MVHEVGEAFDASADVAGEGAGDVVGAFHHEHFEELAPGVGFTGFEVEFGGFAAGVVGGDGDDFIDVSGV